jgi:hypothetical protein
MHYSLILPFKNACFIPNQYCALLDKANSLAQEGNLVDIIYCDGMMPNGCFYNMYQNKQVCRGCRRLTKYLIRQLPQNSNISVYSSSEFVNPEANYQEIDGMHYQSTKDIKGLEYKNAKIGYAALSDYLSLSRNLFPCIDDDFRSYFNSMLHTAAIITECAIGIKNQLKPDVVGVFNSRTVCSRPIVDKCKYDNIQFIAFEAGFDTNNNILRKEYVNSDVHNISTNTKMINELWDSSDIPLDERIKTASNFFMRKRGNIASADKVYTADQINGLLPDNWDHSKHNVVIFNSSEDELAALGEEYDSMSLFPSQYQGIKYIFNQFKDNQDIHFYLRIHPNLKDVPYAYHRNLYDFDNIENVTIIPGSSPISTYTLMDNADKIITFGSSTGAEAAFANKPVILLGCCMYRFLDIAYLANTCEELNGLILDYNLVPKDKMGALKWAYFIMNNEFERIKLYTDHRKIHVKLFNQAVTLTKTKVTGNYLSQYIILLYEILGKYAWMKSNRSYPVKEQPIENLEM